MFFIGHDTRIDHEPQEILLRDENILVEVSDWERMPKGFTGSSVLGAMEICESPLCRCLRGDQGMIVRWWLVRLRKKAWLAE